MRSNLKDFDEDADASLYCVHLQVYQTLRRIQGGGGRGWGVVQRCPPPACRHKLISEYASINCYYSDMIPEKERQYNTNQTNKKKILDPTFNYCLFDSFLLKLLKVEKLKIH